MCVGIPAHTLLVHDVDENKMTRISQALPLTAGKHSDNNFVVRFSLNSKDPVRTAQ